MTTPTETRWPLSPAEECAAQLLVDRAEGLEAEKRMLNARFLRFASVARDAKGLPSDYVINFDLASREWVGKAPAPVVPGSILNGAAAVPVPAAGASP